VYTHLPDFAVSAAGLLATALPAGFAELFLKALRAVACGAALVRAGKEDFDFAAIFFGLATALAMTDKNPREGKGCAPYTTLGGSAQDASPHFERYM
jgi:hypothetical protein